MKHEGHEVRDLHGFITVLRFKNRNETASLHSMGKFLHRANGLFILLLSAKICDGICG